MGTGKTPWRTAVLIIFIALALAMASWIIPVADTVANPAAAHWRTAIAISLTGVVFGAAIWFLVSVSQFKASLRRAYLFFGVGMMLFAASLAQLPVLGLFDLWDSAWVTSGALVAMFAFGAFFMFWGMRQFARLLDMRGWYTSFWVATGAGVIVGVTAYVAAPHLLRYTLAGIETYIAAVGYLTSYVFFAALQGWRIARTIGEEYRPTIRWQSASLTVLTFASVHEMVGTLFVSTGNPFLDYGFYLWPFLLGALFMLPASVAFSQLTRQLAGTAAITDLGTAAPAQDGDYYDSIVAVAGLASRPQAIDLILDGLRHVTSELGPEDSLSDDQKKRLMNVYGRLEAYLMLNDPLRKFTKEEVRLKATPAFRALLAKSDQ